MKIDPNAPAFPAALSMNQHQRYSFLGSVGIPDSSGDYVTFDSLCRMKAAAEEIIAQHATIRARVAELEAERDELKEYNADLRGADELATLFARTLVREEGITVTRALERQREYIAKLEKQSKDYSDLLDVSQGVVRDLRASNAKLTAERDALSAQLRAAGEQEPVAVVTGVYAGRTVVMPLDRSVVLPERMALFSRPALTIQASHDEMDSEVLEQFTRWLCIEMPQGTLIGSPAWWAPKIMRAIRAIRAELGGQRE